MVSRSRWLRHWKDLLSKAFQALRFLLCIFSQFLILICGAFMIPLAPDMYRFKARLNAAFAKAPQIAAKTLKQKHHVWFKTFNDNKLKPYWLIMQLDKD
ncbi:hypothetical protein KA183_12365 [bacterium]|nr:hypothetical protein [bacterium]QQR58072.1 MAG: hypothetical protein IPG59_00880 [Candidatus Melainabacteria bacterium]